MAGAGELDPIVVTAAILLFEHVPGFGQVIDDAERRPLGDERRWYRYHHLFADALRARLVGRHADRIAGLHAAVSRWLAIVAFERRDL